MTDPIGDDAATKLPLPLGVCECGHSEGLHTYHMDDETKRRLGCCHCACESYRPQQRIAALESALLEERTRLREALREAVEYFTKLTQFDHVEWHHDHEDKTPDECPECEGGRQLVRRWSAALAETQP
jgi:hypothetical protein